MRTEYRIIFTMTFNSEADRNNWYEKIKQAAISSKSASPAYRQAHITRDEYVVQDSVTEAI